ncbi:MAG: ABC transporter permease subunit, partial [Methanococcaceae archaeon]
MAIGAGIVLATGGVDLSSMGILTFTSVIYAFLINMNVPIPICIVIIIFIGFLLGSLNGFVISRLYAPPLIFTWAFSIILFTFSLLIANGFIVKMPFIKSTSGISVSLIKPDFHQLIFYLFGVIIGVGLLNYFGFTKKAAAIGANRNSAYYLGIDVVKYTKRAYMLSGMLSAIAGIYYVQINNVASTTNFETHELIPIAIAVLGGTS